MELTYAEKNRQLETKGYYINESGVTIYKHERDAVLAQMKQPTAAATAPKKETVIRQQPPQKVVVNPEKTAHEKFVDNVFQNCDMTKWGGLYKSMLSHDSKWG